MKKPVLCLLSFLLLLSSCAPQTAQQEVTPPAKQEVLEKIQDKDAWTDEEILKRYNDVKKTHTVRLIWEREKRQVEEGTLKEEDRSRWAPGEVLVTMHRGYTILHGEYTAEDFPELKIAEFENLVLGSLKKWEALEKSWPYVEGDVPVQVLAIKLKDTSEEAVVAACDRLYAREDVLSANPNWINESKSEEETPPFPNKKEETDKICDTGKMYNKDAWTDKEIISYYSTVKNTHTVREDWEKEKRQVEEGSLKEEDRSRWAAGELLVTIQKGYTVLHGAYATEDFPELEIEEFENLVLGSLKQWEALEKSWPYPVKKVPSQILRIKLKDMSEEAVVAACELLYAREDVLSANPNWEYSVRVDV